jgi:hypothetical protein
MFPLIETAIAFVVIMLAASLMVTAIVRLLHAWTDRRGRGVSDMLVRLHHGFRAHRDIFSSPGDDAESAFVHDILSDPILHTSDRLAQNNAWNATLEGSGDQKVELERAASRKLAKAIDFIGKDDLISLVERHSVAVDTGRTDKKSGEPITFLALPERWRPGVEPEDARTEDFVAHIERWWSTVEGTIAQEFGQQARRLSVIISCLLVVAVNLDGFRLAWTLYKDRAVSERIAAHADEVKRSADRLRVGTDPDSLGRPPDVPRSDVKLELQLNAAVLTNDALPIGWQNSYIVKRWCAYQGCTDSGAGPPVDPPTRGQLFLDVLMWLAGLAFSCMLLSQGAPFWVRILGTVLRLRNAVQVRKEVKEERAWEVEKEVEKERGVAVVRAHSSAPERPTGSR